MEIQNSTSTRPAGDCWPKHWLPRHWAMALHRKFSLMYLSRFTSTFPDQETVLEWASLWAEHLSGLTGEQIKFGLDFCAQRLEWPPTTAEFRQCCEALPRPAPPRLDPPSIDRERALAAIARIKALIGTPRRPGKGWAEKIVARHARGMVVNDYALRLAREALLSHDNSNNE